MIKKNIGSYGQKNGSSHRKIPVQEFSDRKPRGVLMAGLIAGDCSAVAA